MRHEESRLQQACVKWFRYQYPHRVLFAIPNGGARSKVEAAIMKGEGVLAGAADLFVMASGSNGEHGLFVELKSKSGRLSPAQKEFAEKSITAGYPCIVCRSLDEFVFCVNKYLGKE